MKDIAQQVYDKLTPRQRIIATIEAEARDDAEEVRRLVKSCPKKTYTMNDANYAEEMQMLLADSMSLECDMSHMAINYLLLEKCGKGNLTHIVILNTDLIMRFSRKVLIGLRPEPVVIVPCHPITMFKFEIGKQLYYSVSTIIGLYCYHRRCAIPA